MAEVNDRLIIELEAKIDKLAAGVAAGNRQIQTFARQAEKDLTDLQLKLEIARARGDKKAAEGLADQIQLAQVKSKLMRQGIAETEAQAQAELHLAAVTKARHQAEAGGFGVALDKVFDSSKLAVIEEGSAKLRVFGSAIEPLGALGIGAAIGAVALAEGIEQVRKAGEEVGKIAVRAERLGVGVEALQALDFAAKESHLTTEQLDESLQGLNATLGKLRQGVGDKRIVPEAALLGLKPEDIAKYQDAASFLPDLVERINALPSLGEKVNAAQKFGIEPLLPLILKGKEGVRELEDDFRSFNLILSGETVDAVEKGNLALEKSHEIAHDKIRNDLIDLHPLIVQLGTAWDGFKVKAVDALTTAAGVASVMYQQMAGERFGGASGALRYQSPFLASTSPSTEGAAPASAAGKPTGPMPKQIADQLAGAKELDALQASLLTHTTHRLETEKKIAEIEAKEARPLDPALKSRLLAAADKEDAKPGETAAAAAKRKIEEAERKAKEQAKASQAAIDAADESLLSAKKAELEAQLSATKDEDERAGLQSQIRQLDADHAKVLLKRKDDALRADAGLGTITQAAEKSAIAANDEASRRQENAANIANQAVTTGRAAQKAAEALRLSEIDSQGRLQILQVEATMATTRKERAELERQILELTYREQKAKLQAIIDDRNKAFTGAQKTEAAAQLGQLEQLHPLQQRQLDFNSAGPLDQYLRGIQDLNTEFEQDGVSAIQALDSGLVNAALHAKNLGEVAEQVFLDLIAKVATQALDQEAAPALVSGFKSLLAFIPGFAAGTRDTPDGPILVGENGPEILNPGRGNTIISNSAIRSAVAPRNASPAGVYAPIYNDLRGSIVAEELYDRINRTSAAAAEAGAQRGRALAAGDVQRAAYMGNVNA